MDIVRSIPAYVWMIVSAVFFAWGEYLSKKFGLAPGFSLAIAVLVVDSIGTALWLPAIFERNSLAIMGTAWLLIGMLATVSIGLFVFEESLTHTQFAGIAFAFLALILLNS